MKQRSLSTNIFQYIWSYSIEPVLIDYITLSSLGILNMQNLQDAGIPYPASRFIERFLKKI